VKKLFAIALATAGFALASGAAHAASNVYWSIGISAPPIGTVVSNAPVYYPAPVYEPAPVYYPAPVYEPAPVYVPPPVYYRAAPVVYGGYYDQRGYWVRHRHHHWRDRDHDGIPDWRDDEYGDHHRGDRWAPVPADPRRYHHD
jgi:hypothetical protein